MDTNVDRDMTWKEFGYIQFDTWDMIELEILYEDSHKLTVEILDTTKGKELLGMH